MATNPKNPQAEKDASAINKAFRETAEKMGLKSFVVAFDQGGLLTTHFEAIAMTTASRAIIALFQQLCRFEASNKAHSADYRRAFTELEQDFLEMVGSFNKRLERMAQPKTKAS